ncbi:hypothetical protein GCM10027447_36230 [Glycomyces halotolerans]
MAGVSAEPDFDARLRSGMVQKDRNIKVTGERREQIHIHRIADLLVRLARKRALERGLDTSDLETAEELPGEDHRASNPE